MENQQPLVLRRTARYDVALRARVTLAPEHAAWVKFSAGVTERQGGLEVDVVDISCGGAGLLSGVFIPRNCRLDIRIMGLGGENSEELVKVRAKVHRVIMTDRRPAYLIGTSFEHLTSEQTARLDWLVRQFGDATEFDAATA